MAHQESRCYGRKSKHNMEPTPVVLSQPHEGLPKTHAPPEVQAAVLGCPPSPSLACWQSEVLEVPSCIWNSSGFFITIIVVVVVISGSIPVCKQEKWSDERAWDAIGCFSIIASDCEETNEASFWTLPAAMPELQSTRASIPTNPSSQ